MPRSLLEAFKQGLWDFEPETRTNDEQHPTKAMPGSNEKVDVMADRLRLGLPLWHPSDRRTFDDNDRP